MKKSEVSVFVCGKRDPHARQREADLRRLQALLQVKLLNEETRQRLSRMKARLDADKKELLMTSERELVGKLVVQHGVDMQSGTIKTRAAGLLFTSLPTKPPGAK